jgi:RNA recognition motif 2
MVFSRRLPSPPSPLFNPLPQSLYSSQLYLRLNFTSGTDYRNRFHSDKICDISYANIQGKECLIEKFRNSCVMDEDPSYRPKIFHSSGVLMGQEQEFDPSTLLPHPPLSIFLALTLFLSKFCYVYLACRHLTLDSLNLIMREGNYVLSHVRVRLVPSPHYSFPPPTSFLSGTLAAAVPC